MRKVCNIEGELYVINRSNIIDMAILQLLIDKFIKRGLRLHIAMNTAYEIS